MKGLDFKQLLISVVTVVVGIFVYDKWLKDKV